MKLIFTLFLGIIISHWLYKCYSKIYSKYVFIKDAIYNVCKKGLYKCVCAGVGKQEICTLRKMYEK